MGYGQKEVSAAIVSTKDPFPESFAVIAGLADG
jgi:hypothetical protein